MQANKILARLLLGIAISLPQYVLADTFCSKSPDGLIHTDDCSYTSYEACKKAVKKKWDCVLDRKDTTDMPYCVVTWSTSCTYYDYKSCHEYAEKHIGFCYKNPDYKEPVK